jgi:hypothetical protein
MIAVAMLSGYIYQAPSIATIRSISYTNKQFEQFDQFEQHELTTCKLT